MLWSNGAWSFGSVRFLVALKEGVNDSFSRRLVSRRYRGLENPWRQNESREKLVMVTKGTGARSLI